MVLKKKLLSEINELDKHVKIDHVTTKSSERVIGIILWLTSSFSGYNSPEKTILLFNGLGAWGQKGGSASFVQCPVTRCSLTADRARAADADAILFKDHVAYPGYERPSNQVWILYHLECPYHTQSVKIPDSINWTASYRRDSDIVAPYERWTYYDPEVTLYKFNE